MFNDLFVLEMANNHWGDVGRGLEIIRQYAKVVRMAGVKAAIKFQFRDVKNFIHNDKRDDKSRYVQKTIATELSGDDYAVLVAAVRSAGCIPMATPFDEASVGLCERLNIDIIKIASSDVNDWVLIERIARTKRPVVVSTGGTSDKDTDDIVKFFRNRCLPLAVNHCVSLYPSEDCELELNQIDYLKNRYPNNVIGFSSHEYTDWRNSMLISYAKGARLWERHVDILNAEKGVSAYCSLPYQVAEWFDAYKKAREMCGGPGGGKRVPHKRELAYLKDLVRGVYAARDLSAGDTLARGSYYLAIPKDAHQLDCRSLMESYIVRRDVSKDYPIMEGDVN